jgi:CRISPR-associated protein Cas2
MAVTEFLVVFSYDVQRDNNRRRIAAALEEHATRVQDSVFETRMTLSKASRLLKRLDRERMEGDSIRMYVVTEQGRERSQTCGGPPIAERSEFWLL